MKLKREVQRLNNLSTQIQFPTCAAEQFKTFERQVLEVVKENLDNVFGHVLKIEYDPFDERWCISDELGVRRKLCMPAVRIERWAQVDKTESIEMIIEASQGLVDGLNAEADFIREAFERREIEAEFAK